MMDADLYGEGRKATGIPQMHLYKPLQHSAVDNIAWEELFEYDGILFHVSLQKNKCSESCIENSRLQAVADAIVQPTVDQFEEETDKCMALFWPFVLGALDRKKSLPKKLLKVQFQTVSGVSIYVQHSSDTFEVNSDTYSIESIYPTLPSFPSPSIRRLDALDVEGFKVCIPGSASLYCLKTVGRHCNPETFKREINSLSLVEGHENIVQLTALSECEHGVNCIVISYVDGTSLFNIKAADFNQKQLWKKQISSAIHHIHSSGTTWGDAKPSKFNAQPHIDSLSEGLFPHKSFRSEKFTFMLRHKHFDLKPGEVLFVERAGSITNTSGYDVWVRNENSLEKDFWPCMWLYDAEWKPFGYTNRKNGFNGQPDVEPGDYNIGMRWLNDGGTETTDEQTRVQKVRSTFLSSDSLTTFVNWVETTHCRTVCKTSRCWKTAKGNHTHRHTNYGHENNVETA